MSEPVTTEDIIKSLDPVRDAFGSQVDAMTIDIEDDSHVIGVSVSKGEQTYTHKWARAAVNAESVSSWLHGLLKGLANEHD